MEENLKNLAQKLFKLVVNNKSTISKKGYLIMEEDWEPYQIDVYRNGRILHYNPYISSKVIWSGTEEDFRNLEEIANGK